MDAEIKNFEKAVIDAASQMRDALGAKCIEMSTRIDDYEKSCRINVTFFTLIPTNASAVPGCGPACKGD